MSDLISRQTALDGLKYEMKYGAEIDRCGLDTAYDIIENVASAEPERTKGEWVDGLPYVNSHWWVCSVCHVPAPENHTGYNFCPNCGADLRGE